MKGFSPQEVGHKPPITNQQHKDSVRKAVIVFVCGGDGVWAASGVNGWVGMGAGAEIIISFSGTFVFVWWWEGGGVLVVEC